MHPSFVCLCVCLLFNEEGSYYVVLLGPELTMLTRLLLNSQSSSCFFLPSAATKTCSITTFPQVEEEGKNTACTFIESAEV